MRAADLAACRARCATARETFLAASLLLPRAVHEPACALYAFCRMADDAVDDARPRRHAVARLRERLRLAYAGTPQAAAGRPCAGRRGGPLRIPAALFEALLEGFEWDAHGRRYETLEALHDYAARVAGTVGAMMALLMGVRSADGLARACDLGVAMQLSNIARDVGEDARMGRLYLPRGWMREAGIDPEPGLHPGLHARARRRGAAPARCRRRAVSARRRRRRRLPLACRPGINAARLLYAEIGHEVARRGLDSVSARAVVPGARKAALLLRRPPAGPRAAPLPPLAANRFLVDAASRAPRGSRGRRTLSRARGLDVRAVRSP